MNYYLLDQEFKDYTVVLLLKVTFYFVALQY